MWFVVGIVVVAHRGRKTEREKDARWGGRKDIKTGARRGEREIAGGERGGGLVGEGEGWGEGLVYYIHMPTSLAL